MGARGKLGSSSAFGIQAGLALAQIRPGSPIPCEKVHCRVIASNSGIWAADACQSVTHLNNLACGSIFHRAPTSHSRLSQIARRILGVASLSVADSASTLVTAW